MSGSSLAEIWLESGLLAEGSISKVMEGKAYKMGMRAHKLTFQALWRILTPQFIAYLQENGIDSDELKIIYEGNKTLQSFLKDNFHLLSELIQKNSEEKPNFAFWWSYLEIVSILLMFTKGIPDCQWKIYCVALKEMLPYIARYDHGNYFRCLTIYIADMNQLPKEVEEGFLSGDLAVLHSPRKFSHVDPDHAQEWVVGMSKGAAGLVGITQNVSALQRWALSFHWRSEITLKTYNVYGLDSKLSSCHREETTSGRKRDNDDEDAILKSMKSFLLLDTNSMNHSLCNIATKDQATKEI